MDTLDSSLFSEAVVVVGHKELSVKLVFRMLTVELMCYKTNNYNSVD